MVVTITQHGQYLEGVRVTTFQLEIFTKSLRGQKKTLVEHLSYHIALSLPFLCYSRHFPFHTEFFDHLSIFVLANMAFMIFSIKLLKLTGWKNFTSGVECLNQTEININCNVKIELGMKPASKKFDYRE